MWSVPCTAVRVFGVGDGDWRFLGGGGARPDCGGGVAEFRGA